MPQIAAALGPNGTLAAAIILFLATYAGLMAFSSIRAYIALGSACLFVLMGILPIGKALGAVDWNVILMIAGTMGTVSLFIESRMPARVADVLIEKSPDLRWAAVLLSVFAGVISAFVDNVATVLMVAPVAVTVARKLNVSPVKIIIAIAIASNLQGAATLVGDTTSILLGGAAGMNFVDFFFFRPEGRAALGVGLFWIAQAAFLSATLTLLWVFRSDRQKVSLSEKTVVDDYFPSWLLMGTILCLILVSFLPDSFSVGSVSIAKPPAINGLVCAAFFIAGLVRNIAAGRGIASVKRSLKEIDFFTLLLLASLFVVIGGLVESGAVERIAGIFTAVSGGNLFVIYTILVWFSVIISAFVDNIPYTATMLPVVALIARNMGVAPYLLYFGLLSGATLGGNLTPIGASANIAALGILRKEGHEVSPRTFMKMSAPYTLTAVTVGYILIWLLWR
ncbi:MAG: arsenic transporter [Oscillospiraceae bacterium]|jgi:Na+/H+ antiporter NhaD/arsenite permease-like protein|nr:arsenic transporter [Oscillospiraceae bacterium]